MRELTLAEMTAIHGGKFAEIGATTGGVIGCVSIFPFALIMAVFASDSPYACRHEIDNVFSGILFIGWGTGALVGAGIGMAMDQLFNLSTTEQV